MGEGQILYAKVRGTYVLKFSGDVRYTACAPLSAFIKQLQVQDGYDDILIDLTDAEALDSTNLGLLARIANLVQDRFHHKTTLVSTNANVNRTLETMGLYDVFNIDDQYQSTDFSGRVLPVVKEREQETADAILQAHRILSELNDYNREMFHNVVEALESDLAAR
jgi:anti-anti-sigma factor